MIKFFKEPYASELLSRMPGLPICLVVVAMYITTDKTGEFCLALRVEVAEVDTVLPQPNKAARKQICYLGLTFKIMANGLLRYDCLVRAMWQILSG